VYEGYLERCWADEVYKEAWDKWRGGQRWGAQREREENVKQELEGEIVAKQEEVKEEIEEANAEGGGEERATAKAAKRKRH
jgi:hypothetical protein